MPNNKFIKQYDKILVDSSKIAEEDKKESDKLIKILNDSRYRKLKINEEATTGERISDNVASFGGSWKFIIYFGIFLLTWMAFNFFHILGTNFDPYPFILLNLALSTIAAFQAPIIMMSQNRQAKKDKLDEINDAKVNKQSNAKLNLVMRRLENNERQMKQLQRLIQLDIDMQLNDSKQEGD